MLKQPETLLAAAAGRAPCDLLNKLTTDGSG